MIPDFDPNTGFLPPSIHDATWEEFEERFGTTLQRKDLIKGLLRAVRDLRSCGCRTIYVDGGFTTKKTAPPKDIDVCWDSAGVDLIQLNYEYPIFLEFSEGNKRQKDKYSCEFFRADWEEKSLAKPFLEYFQQYNGTPKGIIKISIINL